VPERRDEGKVALRGQRGRRHKREPARAVQAKELPVGSPAAAGGRCLSSDGEQSADATVADARPADLDHCRPELLVRAAGRSLRRAEVLAQVANKRNGSVRLSASAASLLAVQPNVQLPDNVLQVAQAPSI
jgi:hypothetical protein